MSTFSGQYLQLAMVIENSSPIRRSMGHHQLATWDGPERPRVHILCQFTVEERCDRFDVLAVGNLAATELNAWICTQLALEIGAQHFLALGTVSNAHTDSVEGFNDVWKGFNSGMLVNGRYVNLLLTNRWIRRDSVEEKEEGDGSQ